MGGSSAYYLITEVMFISAFNHPSNPWYFSHTSEFLHQILESVEDQPGLMCDSEGIWKTDESSPKTSKLLNVETKFID